MQTLKQETASSWDSFRKTLFAVLNVLKPKHVFEYGPGESTKIIASCPSVEIIDSVEHNPAWFNKYKWEMPEIVKIDLQTNLELYPEHQGRVDKYDLIFIDGREREKCLYVSRSRLDHFGVVMLHDAERASYKEMIDTFKYKYFTDGGHTVTLTDNIVTFMRLEQVLEDKNLW